MKVTIAMLMVALALAVVPGAAQAALVKPIGEPGGVYIGTVTVGGLAGGCKSCKVRLTLTEDGLELERHTSYVQFNKTKCDFFDSTLITAARLKRDGSFTSEREDYAGGHTLKGRFSGRRVTGKGLVECTKPGDPDDYVTRTYYFSASVKGHDRPPATKTVTCEPLGTTFGPKMFLAVHRGLGCGLAHEQARGNKTGMQCATAKGRIDRAAQTRCKYGNRALEIVKLRNCTTRDLADYGSSNQLNVQAVALVTCPEAQKLARHQRDCQGYGDDPDECKAPPSGFRCARVNKTPIDDNADAIERCTDPADARRMILLAYYSGDAV